MNKLINDIRLGIRLNKFYTIYLLIVLGFFVYLQYSGYALFSSPNDKEVNTGGGNSGRSSYFYHK